MTTDELIKELVKREPNIVLMLEDNPKKLILPAVLSNGELELQVSDGISGERSMSNDYYTWDEAKKDVLNED